MNQKWHRRRWEKRHKLLIYWFGPVKFEPFALSLSKGFDKLSLNGS